MAANISDFSPDSYLEELYQKNQPKFQFEAKTEAEWKLWREKLKTELAVLIGGLPEKTKISKVEVMEKKDFEVYSRVRIAYQVKNYLKIPAYLLLPTTSRLKKSGEKYPAVIIAHGHGNGSRETLGLDGTGKILSQATSHNNLALDFVRAGYLVIVPEQIGFGDRRLKEDYDSDPELKDNPAANSCYQISSRLLLSGESILKYRLWDIISALRVLEKRDDVLKDQIKIVGFSGGAPAAVLASLFEDRIDEVAISGYTSYYKDSIMARRHCLDNYLPGILKLAELPTIISAIAPRPLLIQAAEADHLFPPESAVLAYQEIKRVYRFLNAEAEIEFNLIQGEHSAEAEPIIKFFDQIY